MTNFLHLNQLNARLSNERARLSIAKNPKEIALRKVWVKQLENEIAAENKFLGADTKPEITPDQAAAMLAELGI